MGSISLSGKLESNGGDQQNVRYLKVKGLRLNNLATKTRSVTLARARFWMKDDFLDPLP